VVWEAKLSILPEGFSLPHGAGCKAPQPNSEEKLRHIHQHSEKPTGKPATKNAVAKAAAAKARKPYGLEWL